MSLIDKHFDLVTDIAIKLTKWMPTPLYKICYGILSLLLFLWPVILFYVICFLCVRKIAYTPSNCSVCGKPTGIKGNKRFLLANGVLCSTCADKITPLDTKLPKRLPNWFNDFTVKKATDCVQYYDRVGRAEVIREIEAAREEKRKKGIVCPKCGGTQVSATRLGEIGVDVQITCLNCGYQWRPGSHRSW